MNIKEIFNHSHSQINNLEEFSKVNNKSSSSNSSQESEDLKTFNELMQECKKVEPQIPVPPNADNAQIKVNDKLLKNLKNIRLLDGDFGKISNINDIRNISYLNESKRIEHKHKIDLSSLDDNDLKALKQMLENPNMTINNINQQNLQINFAIPNESGQISYKSLDCSKTLFSLIEYSYKSQKPIRLDFNNESSVILKIDKEGKLSAEFIASSKGMEALLKDNLQNLKNKLDSEGVEYKSITYRDNSKKQNKKEDKGG